MIRLALALSSPVLGDGFSKQSIRDAIEGMICSGECRFLGISCLLLNGHTMMTDGPLQRAQIMGAAVVVTYLAPVYWS